MSVNLKSLIGKLNDTVRGTLEGAAGLCLSRTHYDVEIEHFLVKLLDSSGSDLACAPDCHGDRSPGNDLLCFQVWERFKFRLAIQSLVDDFQSGECGESG